MDTQTLEKVFNETFAGLTLYYRDTTLSEDLIANYKIGQIIMERGFTDVSYKGGGLKSNFRYLIASAFGKDLSAFNPTAAEVGHIVLTSKAYFKVLDIYRLGNKTQVFLLNIPEYAIDLFYSSTTNLETDIIKKARESFDNKIDTEPIEKLQSNEWKERTKFPIGMNDKGVLFFDNSQLKNTPPKPSDSGVGVTKGNEQKKPWWKFW
jgi:hypothetical protein